MDPLSTYYKLLQVQYLLVLGEFWRHSIPRGDILRVLTDTVTCTLLLRESGSLEPKPATRIFREPLAVRV